MYRLTGALATVAVTASTADDGGRLLTGLAVPWGVQGGASSHGRLTVDRGSVAIPADLRRVKLLRDHDRTSPVGYLQAAEDTDQGLVLTFRLASTPAGDSALLEASEGLRDGLSVEVDDPVIRNGHLTGGRLVAVAQCAVPAWDDARLSLTASDTTPPPDTPAPTPPDGTEPAPDVPPGVPDPTAGTADDDDPDDPAPDPEDPMPPTTVTAAQVAPALTSPRETPPVTFRAAMAALAAGSRGELSEQGVRAALVDVVPANDVGQGFLRPAWIGELWNASDAPRNLIGSITSKALPATGTKVYGWGWDTKPTGAKYSGNKADVPSTAASTKAMEAPVFRWAGANDVDRIYVDRGEAGFREAYFSMLAEDYARDTEAEVAAYLLAQATAVPMAAAELPAVIVDAGARLSAIGAVLSFVAASPDVYAGAFSITSQEAPWLLGQASADVRGPGVTIGGIRAFAEPGLPPNTVLVGDKRSATYWEDAPPIRLETVNIPQGGVDWGLFGYYAYLVNDARALLAYDVTTTP